MSYTLRKSNYKSRERHKKKILASRKKWRVVEEPFENLLERQVNFLGITSIRLLAVLLNSEAIWRLSQFAV